MPLTRKNVLTFLLLISPFCRAFASQAANLAALYRDREWFALRAAVEHGHAPLFYQGIVACTFNEPRRCERDLQPIITAAPGSRQAYEAHDALRYFYFRTGHYKAALAQVDFMLKAKPNDADAKNDRSILSVLSEYPDQMVVKLTASTLNTKPRTFAMPISINGKSADYFIDTGSNLSVISESEAHRFGLAVRAVTASVGTTIGREMGTRVAVARNVMVGQAHLANVAFLVVPDDLQPFRSMAPGTRGLIGLPLLMALGTLRWNSQGTLQVGFPSERQESRPNLCFDRLFLIVQARIRERKLEFHLDSGATWTELWPRFAIAFAGLVKSAGKRGSTQVNEMAGSRKLSTFTLAKLGFQLGGFPVLLRPARVLLTQTSQDQQWYYGNLGVDLLRQAKEVIMDFHSMALTLE